MKPFLIPVYFMIAAIGTFCSCTSTPCASGSFHFGLVGFTQAEADTIVVRRYFIGNNFTNMADSFMLQPGLRAQQDTLEINSLHILSTYLIAGYDYQLIFPSAGRTIRLTDINEEKREVKHSIFSNVKIGCENTISGMKADGVSLRPAGFNNFYFSR